MKPWQLILAAMAAVTCVALVTTLAPRLFPRDPDPACIMHAFEGSRFIVCTFDARKDELLLASRGRNGDYLRGFDALAHDLDDDAARVRFAMNAGMFDDAGAPIGLYVEEGDEQHVLRLTDGPGNFHMKPNGVFWQGPDGALHITTSDTFAEARPRVRYATQSGPMLLIDGALHPRFASDGPSRYVRNGVGLRDAHTAYFVISSGVVSFGRFARFFRDELGCRDALFFDGAVSSAWIPEMRRSDDVHALGPMVVVLSAPTRR